MHRGYPALAGALVIALGALAATTWLTPAKQVEAQSVQTVKVGQGTVVHTVALAGTVVSNQSVSLAYSGDPTTVQSVKAAVGDSVTKGETLATMANGAVITAPFAGQVVADNLVAGDLVPQTASSTTSPSSGSTGSVGSFTTGGRFGRGGAAAAVSTQSVVSADSPLSITVANLKDVSISASVSEMDVHAIRVGETVAIGIIGEPGYRYHGVVTSLSDVPTAASSGGVTYPLTVSLPIGTSQARPWLGMSAELEVDSASATGLTVPVAAVHTLGSGWGVKLGSGRMTPVTLGLTSTNSVIVRSGLTAGETIVTPKVGTGTGKVTVEILPSFGSFGGFPGGTGGSGGYRGYGGGGGFGGF